MFCKSPSFPFIFSIWTYFATSLFLSAFSELIMPSRTIGIRQCDASMMSKTKMTAIKWAIGWCRESWMDLTDDRICQQLSKISKKSFRKPKPMFWAKSQIIRCLKGHPMYVRLMFIRFWATLAQSTWILLL